MFPDQAYSVNLRVIAHRACAPLVRVIAHPGDDEVDPDHIVFLLLDKLFAARADADLHSMSESHLAQDHI
jgi:hypothetical protein